MRAQKVFLTGASSGLGQALAREYAARGAILGLVGRREAALRELAASLPNPNAARVYAADVRDADAMAAAAQDFLDHFGCPDIVVANAGVSVGTVAGEREDLAAFRLVMDTNWFGVLTTFQPFLQPMRAAERGAGGWRGTLVGIASVAGVRGLPGAGAYSASKSAVIKLLESLRLEERANGIRVVTIAPGYIRTPMTAHNPYRMPFLMDADVFARKAVRAIAAGRRFAVVPWQMGVVAGILHVLPRWLYDALAARAPRKPRKPDPGSAPPPGASA
ncbi:short-chain dehydrogenase [Cupriavidus sp. USMAA2-4]|uniref:Short-chain dehydrogenase n=1 Tax=Cupriavidus malaysiensis TaxID=367825 RepID=A0ABM6F8F7_9BURK|nr:MULTISPECIES: SDR family oxidoreductase [Cupriavidus]AOY94100.1 short-chain dehydrogenase [Cupriavidus sp. USMAA2-4]AOY98396.1 short-chain dehydrogenase [Cupriavidus sp. USMAHM13]AOZ07911.1 short-chain dehydrogenase [Cupriavidus malaysiensis]